MIQIQILICTKCFQGSTCIQVWGMAVPRSMLKPEYQPCKDQSGYDNYGMFGAKFLYEFAWPSLTQGYYRFILAYFGLRAHKNYFSVFSTICTNEVGSNWIIFIWYSKFFYAVLFWSYIIIVFISSIKTTQIACKAEPLTDCLQWFTGVLYSN